MVVYLLTGLALAVALYATWRSYVHVGSPKAFAELRARIEALEFSAGHLSDLVTREQRRQLAAEARAAKAGKNAHDTELAREAAALLTAPPAAPAPSPPESPEVARARMKAALRVKAGLAGNLLPPR